MSGLKKAIGLDRLTDKLSGATGLSSAKHIIKGPNTRPGRTKGPVDSIVSSQDVTGNAPSSGRTRRRTGSVDSPLGG